MATNNPILLFTLFFNAPNRSKHWRQRLKGQLFSLLAGFFLCGNLTVAAQEIDQIIAIVKDDVLMQSELVARARFLRSSNDENKALSEQALANKALNELVLEQLQVQYARTANLSVPENLLEEALRTIARQNNLDIGGFRRALQQQGIDFNQFREQTRRKLLVDAIRKQLIRQQVSVSEQEVDELIASQAGRLPEQTSRPVQESRVRHILISTNDKADAQAQTEIRQIYQQLQTGTDFATLAGKHSDDPGSKDKGGDLGWTPPGRMVGPFDQVMQQQVVNTVSEPFKTRFGWHILEVLERRQVNRPGDELRQKATNFLGERKSRDHYQAWLQNLRRNAYIDYRLPQAKKRLQLQ